MATPQTLDPYEAFAAVYDRFCFRVDFEMWLGEELMPELLEQGLESPGAALDVACGTGLAFPPLLRRGWQVHGCDISAAMVAVARRRFGERVRLDVADMRQLPVLGRFQLAVVLGDGINHLLSQAELEAALAGIAANLAPGGLLVFDCNTSGFFSRAFSTSGRQTTEYEDERWIWQGLGEAEPGIFEVEITGDSLSPVHLTERYHPPAEVEAAIEAAGLEPRKVLGQRETGGRVALDPAPDESRDAKIIHIAAAPST